MADLARAQLKEVLDAYAARDADRALAVWRGDEQIDATYNSLFRELLTYMMEDPRNIGSRRIFCSGRRISNVSAITPLISPRLFITSSAAAISRTTDRKTTRPRRCFRPDRMPSSSPVPDADLERYARLLHAQRPPMLRGLGWALAAIVLYGFCLKVSGIDLGRLVSGLPRLAGYLAKSWPPNFEDFDAVLRGAGETIAIATLGTTLGAVLAVPLCLLGARNITPALTLLRSRPRHPQRVALDRYVRVCAAVRGRCRLRPIFGHPRRRLPRRRIDRETLVGGDRGGRPASHRSSHRDGRLASLVWRYGLLPTIAPGLASVLLYMWEFNIRSSTVLGLVGAGGMGQQLKNAVDLLDFACGAHHRRHPADGRVRRRLERVRAAEARRRMIRVHNLSVRYGTYTAVEDAGFILQHNRVTVLLGPSGAGKTSSSGR